MCRKEDGNGRARRDKGKKAQCSVVLGGNVTVDAGEYPFIAL
jgi:hypothetical protein